MISLRVTSIWKKGEKKTVFAGIPVTTERQVKNAGQIIVVHTPSANLPIDPAKGQCWNVYGQSKSKEVEHNGYSLTEIHIQAEKLELTLPNDGENFICFVAQNPDFRGIGEVKARKLWSAFGRDLYSIIQRHDTDTLTPYLSEDSIQALYNGWKKYANLHHLDWFLKRNIPANIVGRLLRRHGEDSINAIQADPYRLMNFGLSWKDTDALALEYFEIEAGDTRRLSAAVEDALIEHTGKGHTVASHDDLFPRAHKRLKRRTLASEALKSNYSSQKFVRGESELFHPVGIMVMERVVALRFQKLAATSEEWQEDHNKAFHQAVSSLQHSLMEKQKDACVQALTNGISVITGGAGTGKTTVLRVIMDAYSQLDYSLYPMALSGRAAMRIKESTGYKSRTIAGFLKSETLKELKKNIVIIDEASMVDLPTMYRIVTKIPDTTRILLVGDAGQLQPIGPGLILHDVVQSNSLPLTELDIVKRQDSSTGIPEYTRKVRHGLLPESLNVGNIRFHETSKFLLNNKVLDLYSESPEQTQIIGATYKPEHGGIDTLNQMAQRLMNTLSPGLQFKLYGENLCLPLRLDDPVIFTQNDWDADVQNGSLGKLISIEQTDEHFGIVQLDTGREVEITEAMLDSLRLAYAISLHKAQGSQFSRIIVPLADTKMLDRTWIYTALTRAEKSIEIVGESRLLEKAIHLKSATQRKTWLHQLLKN